MATMVPVQPVAATNAAPGWGRQQRRRPRPARQRRPAVNLPNDINAPTARISYYKLFLEFMNYKDNNAYEYGRLFSE